MGPSLRVLKARSLQRFQRGGVQRCYDGQAFVLVHDANYQHPEGDSVMS